MNHIHKLLKTCALVGCAGIYWHCGANQKSTLTIIHPELDVAEELRLVENTLNQPNFPTIIRIRRGENPSIVGQGALSISLARKVGDLHVFEFEIEQPGGDLYCQFVKRYFDLSLSGFSPHFLRDYFLEIKNEGFRDERIELFLKKKQYLRVPSSTFTTKWLETMNSKHPLFFIDEKVCWLVFPEEWGLRFIFPFHPNIYRKSEFGVWIDRIFFDDAAEFKALSYLERAKFVTRELWGEEFLNSVTKSNSYLPPKNFGLEDFAFEEKN